ncbi:MAG: VWA domain-containing protein [Acidobacteriota bacterium]
MRRFLQLFLCASLTIAAQQQAPTPAPAKAEDDVIFRSDTRLVVQQVTVKDKSGKPVEGLTAKDFTITESGVLQTVAFLEFQKLEEIQAAPVLKEAVAPTPRLAHSQIAAERPLDVRYADRRLLAFYFDMSAMPPADQLRALGAAQDFIRKQMTPADLVAILKYSGNEVLVHEDFTADRERLLSTLETMIVGEDENVPEQLADGAFGQSGGEFAIFRTDRQLSALQTAAKMLGQLNEKKSLIYFASGLRLNGTDNQAQMRATVNAATRAGVAFFTIDARGLVANAPMGDATRPSPGGAGAYSGASAMTAMTNLQRSQDTLWSLAADTGGKALLDANDLGLGIKQAQEAITSYYVLGYYTTNAALDGKQRKIKITLNGEFAGTVEYRDSYFAGKEFKKFTTADKERQLEDAFMLGDPITELTMAMEVNYFQLNKAEYFVPIAIKIPGSELALAKRGGAEHTLLDFMGEIRSGGPANNVRDKIDIKLSDATAEQLATSPVTYDTGFTVLPGNYKIKFLARDAETGRIGTYETSVVIPNLNPKADVVDSKLAISSVVLSSQRTEMTDALFNANKDKAASQVQQSVNPLVQEGQKLIPSVTRVFSKAKPMYVYLQAYQQGAEPPQPLAAFVTFYSGETKAFETAPVLISERVANRLNTMPVKLSFPLEKLVPGEYRLQVTVLNPSGQKAAFWQTPVMLVP